jgi:hypothetical protein
MEEFIINNDPFKQTKKKETKTINHINQQPSSAINSSPNDNNLSSDSSGIIQYSRGSGNKVKQTF